MEGKISIGGRNIGEGEATYIIAEAGSNHNRSLSQAKELIDVAAECGVDAVKFQLFKAERFYSQEDPLFAVMKENECPREWLKELSEYAAAKDVVFLASPFDEDAVDLLQELKVPALKIASSETTNLALLRYSASTGLPLFISTGMCDLADIYEAVEIVYSAGNQKIILLQCTALYPTEPHDVNLRVMDTLRNAFGLPVGFSDHTDGMLMPAVAVARGACVIEKHFTLSRKLRGSDHFYAIEPDELKQMVAFIRIVEESLGTPEKRMNPKVRESARRCSLIAACDISKGTEIKAEFVEIRRPAIGIEPRFLSAVVGQRAKKEIRAGEPISWDKI